VLHIERETARAKTFRLGLDRPMVHRAGQHVVLRLRAPDGYTAQRSYSIASPPGDGKAIDLTVERLAEGEVSSFLHDEVRVGDRLEVRGPLGGYFAWGGATPALLVAGGSGLVPIMAMLRLARSLGRPELLALVASVRAPGDLLYAAELPGPEVHVVYTRQAPAGAARPPGRLARVDLAPYVSGDRDAYVCGGAGFCDHATDLLESLQVAAARIRVERFGPTG